MSNIDKLLSIYGTVKVGEKGQIVIPSKARKDFDVNAGDLLLVIGGKDRPMLGITLMKADAVKQFVTRIARGLEEPVQEGG